jgi:hypothetical protein
MAAKVYLEAANSLTVYDECDILIVGGGSAGHSAALAAARAGAKNIILMERYGYMGGDVTGGYVIMVPALTWYDKSFVRGIQEEWFTRLGSIPDAVLGPSLSQAGMTDPFMTDAWKGIHGCVTRGKPPMLVRAVYFEPNQLKIEMDKMLLEERDRIKVLYHSWGTKPIMDGSDVKGVIFESKEGRQAIYAKTVIDATGDGDIFRQTGTPYAALASSNTRSDKTALVWRIGGISWDRYQEWLRIRPGSDAAMYQALGKIAGFPSMIIASSRNDVCWVNNWIPNKDCAKIADLTKSEIIVRDSMRDVLEYLREVCPVAFRNAYLYDIAPQMGARCSYRLSGEYMMTPNDFTFAPKFDDVIAWHSTVCPLNDNGPVEIPYRSILPKKVDNLLCPGRHLSADDIAIDWLTLIPQCIGTGQAAGVAAAVSLAEGTSVRNVNIKKVQDILVDQDVPLPRHPRTDPSLTQFCEEHEYGLYTDMAKAAKAEGDARKVYDPEKLYGQKM